MSRTRASIYTSKMWDSSWRAQTLLAGTMLVAFGLVPEASFADEATLDRRVRGFIAFALSARARSDCTKTHDFLVFRRNPGCRLAAPAKSSESGPIAAISVRSLTLYATWAHHRRRRCAPCGLRSFAATREQPQARSNLCRVPIALYQGQELAVIFADLLVDARVQLIVQCHHHLALGGAVLRQVVRLLRVFLQVEDFKVVVGDQRLVSGWTVEMKRREVPAEPVAAVEDASYGASVVEIRLQSHNFFELLHHGIIRHDDPYQ